MEIKYRNTSDLIPYARNSRVHSDAQATQIGASIKEFGFTNPILTDGDNGIIAGHGRLMAAKKLKLDTVPTIELSGLTKAQKQAYIIADNKLALLLAECQSPKESIFIIMVAQACNNISRQGLSLWPVIN